MLAKDAPEGHLLTNLDSHERSVSCCIRIGDNFFDLVPLRQHNFRVDVGKPLGPQRDTQLDTVFQVAMNTDQTEGRGWMRPIGAFRNPAEANKAATGLGPMGYGDGEVSKIKVYRTFDEWVRDVNEDHFVRDFKLHHRLLDPKARARISGLSKLTPEEREALGVKP